MNLIENSQVEEVLNWCASVLGACTVVSDPTREHPGQRASVFHLRAPAGNCFVKIHRDPSHWDSEVHGYERWAPVFGRYAPRLLAVRDAEPLALVVAELPGKVLEEAVLAPGQEDAVWRDAGRALAALHALEVGEYFGPCRRDGTCAGALVADARQYVELGFENWLERGVRGRFLKDDELSIVRAARELIEVFAGERPLPCHRDYCPANWLVGADGAWAGVIDFEFAYWDVRAADFTRYPGWDWIQRPERADAFFEGYGRSFTLAEEQQRMVAHVQYALGAIVWGMENAYYVYAGEGRQALAHLGRLL